MQPKLRKIFAFLLCFLLCFEQSGFAQMAGQLDISGHLASLRNAFAPDVFRPLHLRYLSYDNLNNNFRIFLDKGSLKNPKSQGVEKTTKELLNYFFVGITLPNDAFWVNLRPDAETNIIDDQLAQTDVGRILLESDLQLKKDTARFTSPETPEGRQYWDKLYQKAGEIFGYDNVTIPTLTRPWIVPDEIIIRETTDSAYIYKATLKVMLEQDYLKGSAVYNFEDGRLKELNEYSSQLIREIIIPKLTQEINASKRYAQLRQVYYSLIMAQWFKARFTNQSGLYSRIIDRRVIFPALYSKDSWSKTTYFQAYQESFKDGEYNIQEPVYSVFGQTIRSYFSGGEVFNLGRMPSMGEMIRNPETGATISSIPTASAPALNPKVVIGVKVNATDNPGEVGLVRIENRDIEVSVPDKQEISQESKAQIPLEDSTSNPGAQVSNVKNLDRLLRILNVLRKSKNVPEIAEDASDREILEFCIQELERLGLILTEEDADGNIIINIKATALYHENKAVARLVEAIRKWIIDAQGGVRAINFQGIDGRWRIVGFLSDLDEDTLKHEQTEIKYRKQGLSWIEAHNKVVSELRKGDLIDAEAVKGYKAGRQNEIGAIQEERLSPAKAAPTERFRVWLENISPEQLRRNVELLRSLDKLFLQLDNPSLPLRELNELVAEVRIKAGVPDGVFVSSITSLIDYPNYAPVIIQGQISEVIRDLVKAGALDKKLLQEKILLHKIFNKAKLDHSNKAIGRSLFDVGVLDREPLLGGGYQYKFNTDFFELGMSENNRSGIAIIDMSKLEKSVPLEFHYYYLRLLEKLREDPEAAYNIFGYLDADLLALAQSCPTMPDEDSFYARLAEMIKGKEYSVDEAKQVLLKELLAKPTNPRLDFYQPTRSWDNLEEWLNALGRFPLLADKICAHIIVTMKLLQQGVGEQAAFSRNAANVENRLPGIRQALIRALDKIHSPLLRRRLVKALALGSSDQIDRLRNQAVALVQAATGLDDSRGEGGLVIGNIRNRIHNFPSPVDLSVVRAYLEFVETGNTSQLEKLGYTMKKSDRVARARKTATLRAAQDLLTTLEDVYGEGSQNTLTEYFQRWQNVVPAQEELKGEIRILLNSPPEDVFTYLERIIEVRRSLFALQLELSGEALLLAISLDNRLEILFYRKFNEFNNIISYSQPQQAARVIVSLLENARLNGYAPEEIEIILPEVKSLQEKESFGQEDYLRLYAIYGRIERFINLASKSAIEDFQEMAARLGRAIGASNNLWVENFSSNIFRSDTIYLLSLALSKAKEAAMQQAGISGWQVVVPGNSEGRIRFISDIKELATVKPDEIIVIDYLPSEAPPVTKVAAIITLKNDSLLSHPAIRARQYNIPFVVCPDVALLKEFNDQWVSLEIKGGEEVVLTRTEKPAKDKSLPSKKQPAQKISLIEPDLSSRDFIIMPEDYRSDLIGNKGYRLNQIPTALLPSQISSKHFSLGFSLLRNVLGLDMNSGIKTQLDELADKALRNPDANDIADTLQQMRLLIENLVIPDADLEVIIKVIEAVFGKDTRLFLRSSTNAEDLSGYQAAGLYDSFGNVLPTKEELAKYIKKVWASIWNERAFFDREAHSIDHTTVFPAVLIQEMFIPDYAFVIHTQNPADYSKNEVVIEAVQGFGESLVGGQEEYVGSPYRFVYDRLTGKLKLISFCNKSKKIIIKDGFMQSVYVSYRDDKLPTQDGMEFIKDIAEASLNIEKKFKGWPQDIEGAILLQIGNWKVAFLQSRDEKIEGQGGNSEAPTISSTGFGDERQANRNILEGIVDIAIRQGLITNWERDRRLRDFDTNPRSVISEDFYLQVDNQNVFLINGQKVVVIDKDYLSTTEEGEQYASAGLRRGVVYITRAKFQEWQQQGILEQKIKHEQDEVAYLRKKALQMFLGLDEAAAYELFSNFLKRPTNEKEARDFINEAHNYAKGQEVNSPKNNVVDDQSSFPLEGTKRPVRLPLTSEGAKTPGGIDFHNLPIVTQAVGNLSANIGSSSINRFNNINLNSEWRDIENLVSSGITPSTERIKEYVQASCYKGSVDRDIDKVISCISDILRIEEERYSPTDPTLKDILVVLDSANSVQQLKAVFIGTTP